MKHLNFYIKLFLIIFSLFVSISLLAPQQIDRIVANVNGVGISLSQLQEYAKPYLEKKLIENTKNDMLKLLETIIDEELIYQIFEENSIIINDEHINKAINNIKNELETNDIKMILEYLNSPSEYVLKRKLKIDIGNIAMIKKAEANNKLSFNVILPSYDEISDYYNDNYYLFKEDEEININHIIISYDDEIYGERDKAHELIKEILDKIKENKATFYEMAIAYSKDITTNFKGGNLGYYKKFEVEKLYPFYTKIALSLEPNEISNIIYLNNAFAIIMINDIRIVPEKKMSEVSNLIYKQLLKKNYFDAFKIYFEKFKEESYIEIMY